MKINIKRFDKNISLPKYEKDAYGFDFYCRENISINLKEIIQILSNVAIEVPKWYVLLIFSRSSTPIREWLIIPQWVWVIDPFYSWDDNEIKLIFQNIMDKIVKVRKWDKLAQWILFKTEKVEFNEVEYLKKSIRRNLSYNKVLLEK